MMISLLAVGTLTGCKKAEVKVTITDGYTTTQMNVPSGMTVQEILDEAEISVAGKDILLPYTQYDVITKDSDIEILRYAKAEVVTENGQVELELTGGTVQDALQKADIELVANDYVNHDMNAFLTNRMTISVVHRLDIAIKADGRTEHFLTQADTVGELLAEQEITLGELDRVKPALDSKLSDGSKVVVKRVEVKEVTEIEPILFETEVTYSNSMTVGTSSITTEGINGEKEVTYEITYVDGKEESRKVIRETVLKEAVNQVLVQGSKPKGKTVVSKETVYDCDGSGHGYYIITYSDGTVEYKDF